METVTDLPLSFGLDVGALQSAKNKMEMNILNVTKAKKKNFKVTKLKEL